MMLRQMPILVALFMLNRMVFCADAPDSNLDAAIHSKYFHKAFTLRGFYSDRHLHFDSSGSPEGEVYPGSWTTAVVSIEKTKVSASSVELGGQRFAEVYDWHRAKFTALRPKLDVRIEVDRDPNQSDASVEETIDRIFLGPQDKLADLVPDYWHPFVANKIEIVQRTGLPVCYRINGQLQRTEDGTVIRNCEEDADTKSTPAPSGINVSSLPYTYKPKKGGGLSYPQRISDPAPEYSDAARAIKLRGNMLLQLTITPGGGTSDIAILKPLGAGLDEQAVAAVKTWKFEPAKLKGLAVPVRLEIEVGFNMY